MTVGELIKILSVWDKNLRVVVTGYDECGIDDVGTVEKIKVVLGAFGEGYHSGAHASLRDGHMVDFQGKEVIDAILIDF